MAFLSCGNGTSGGTFPTNARVLGGWGTYTVTKGNYILQTAYGGRATTQTDRKSVV